MVAFDLLLTLLLIQSYFFSSGFTSPSSPALSPASLVRGGFKTKLIHRDAFGSPFYNPNLTEWDKTQLKISRSKARYSNWDSSLFTIKSRITNGEFIMWFNVGLPPQPAYAVVDTGSNLIWIQCDKCTKCLKQKPRLFSPSASTTYKPISYEDDRCLWLGIARFGISDWDQDTCQYKFGYGDQTQSVGHLSEDTFSFEQWESTERRGLIVIKSIVFGCGLENTAQLYQPAYPPGVIGLNNHKLSLLSQFGLSKFSTCISFNIETTINFGASAVLAGDRIPLMDFRQSSGKISREDYFVSLLGISLVYKHYITKLDISPHFLEPALGGGALIDTGTSVTVVPTVVLDILMDKLENYFYSKERYDSTVGLPLCYKDTTFKDLEELSPEIRLDFNGTKLYLSTEQMWSQDQSDDKSDAWCLAMYSKRGFRFLIIGTQILANYNIGYNMNTRQVSLMSDYC